MAKVITLTPRNDSQEVAMKAKKQALLQRALKKAKSYNGIDYYKVITGDEQENQRLKFLQHQEKLNLY